MGFALRTIMLGAASLLALTTPAFAADTADSRDLQTVIVTAKKDPNDPAVVAEARARLSETPGGVAVVANETYADRYALTLGDTLGQVAGVFAQKKFGEDSRFAIRGSGIGNNIHNRGSWLAIDGVPINLADGSGDFQELDPLTARYIEVYKGGNALRFGGAQLGGAVNFVTPTGHNAGFNQKLRVEGGSFKTLRLHGAVAGVAGNTDYYAALTHTQAEGWRQHSDQRAKRLTFSVGQTFGEGRDLRLILQVNDIDQEIPGALTLAQALNSPKQTTLATTALINNGRNVKSVRATVQGHWALNDDWRLTGGLYAAGKELNHPISIYIDQDYQNYGAFARLDGEFTVGNQRGDLFAGVNLRRGQTGSKIFLNVNSARGMMTGRAQQNAEAVDLFGEARLFLTDEVAFIAGGTYGWTNRDYVNQLNLKNNTKKTFDWFAPRLGLLWENAAGTQVFANLTRSVEAPTYGALVQGAIPNFVPVEPQDAWTAEIGTRGRLEGLIWDLTLYRAEIRKEMLSYIVSPDIPAATFNANKTVHQGLEAGLDWKLGTAAGWTASLHQTYSWSDFRFVNDRVYGDNRLPVVPEHMYRAGLKLTHSAGFSLTPSVDWVPSKTWVDFANTTKAPGYTLVNLTARYTSKQGWDLFAEARNLADERYVSNANGLTNFNLVPAASRAVFWPGEGRAVFVGVTLTR